QLWHHVTGRGTAVPDGVANRRRARETGARRSPGRPGDRQEGKRTLVAVLGTAGRPLCGDCAAEAVLGEFSSQQTLDVRLPADGPDLVRSDERLSPRRPWSLRHPP